VHLQERPSLLAALDVEGLAIERGIFVRVRSVHVCAMAVGQQAAIVASAVSVAENADDRRSHRARAPQSTPFGFM
jgi:hypothetical protein